MRINLTKKDLVNSIYMQIGFSKQISGNLLEEFLYLIIQNLNSEKKIKISKFWNIFNKKKNQELEEIQRQKRKKKFPREM